MKQLLALLLFCPLAGWSQSETVIPGLALPKPPADTLKPIEIREYPYTYGNRSYVTTSLARIYSYDGVDVQHPAQELWPRMRALNDPDVNREYQLYTRAIESRSTARVFAGIFTVGGMIAMIAGGIQARDYQQALNAKRQAWYALPTRLITTPAPSTISKTCSSWIGSKNSSGVMQWTCMSDLSIKVTGGDSPPLSVQVPNPNQTPTTSFAPQPPIPTSVDMPTGKGLLYGGLTSVLIGTVIWYTSPNTGDHFHRAVQLYNRALPRKISWQLLPYSQFGMGGLTLLGTIR
jgi:hypothetical protein